jgi:hypothetical protein
MTTVRFERRKVAYRRLVDEHRFGIAQGQRRPLLILTFDDANTLIDYPPVPERWDLFFVVGFDVARSCVEFYNKSNASQSFCCSVPQQDASIYRPHPPSFKFPDPESTPTQVNH